MAAREENLLPKKELADLFKGYRVIAAYLFGSRADGTSTEDSDYDLAVLVEDALDRDKLNILLMEIEEQGEKLLQKKVDVVCLNTAALELKFLIISRGQVVYSIDEETRTDFEDIVIRDYLDFKPFLEIYRREVREAIKEGDFYA